MAIVALFIGSGAFSIIGYNSVMAEGAVIPGSQSIKIQIDAHPATEEEINQMKSRLGVYDPSKNYNVIFGGHGTGFAPPTEEEWNSMVGSIEIVDGVKMTAGSLKASVDLSADPCFPAVRSQGGQGSCAAWAATYYAAGYLQAKDNGWTQASSGNNDNLLSPAFTYNKCNDGSDSGSSMWGNGKIMQTVGVCRWSQMPYDDSDCISWGMKARGGMHRNTALTTFITYIHHMMIQISIQ